MLQLQFGETQVAGRWTGRGVELGASCEVLDSGNYNAEQQRHAHTDIHTCTTHRWLRGIFNGNSLLRLIVSKRCLVDGGFWVLLLCPGTKLLFCLSIQAKAIMWERKVEATLSRLVTFIVCGKLWKAHWVAANLVGRCETKPLKHGPIELYRTTTSSSRCGKCSILHLIMSGRTLTAFSFTAHANLSTN